jgi:hypothetical protein
MTTAERQARFRQSLRERGLVELRGAFVPPHLVKQLREALNSMSAEELEERLRG